MDKTIGSAAEAVAEIGDGATVMIGDLVAPVRRSSSFMR
ncbi:hypothetical protein C064_02387 [Brucella suis 63/252]|nr:3-oxoadipate CoA-transferase [Brucella canis HSK A52141]AIJ83794.1 putative 3-oxoadipate CoA-transferase subunit a [Brucella canis]AIJ98002.1 putative 3-oxoadipate CoA-transferase subunit a [Brucella suis]ENQ56238.1 hypothetical protein C969_02760 [Brucella canis CNGB 1172]ENQ59085.1 hypothetical protein C979_02574 [Brucella canis UK10/02]ENR15768.1 hypothetical protein C064_02387 [Brucella suis 63/252]ENS43389.1 hypothetical protein B976_03136 [Brucella canis 79/122]ENS49978.1 hypothetic